MNKKIDSFSESPGVVAKTTPIACFTEEDLRAVKKLLTEYPAESFGVEEPRPGFRQTALLTCLLFAKYPSVALENNTQRLGDAYWTKNLLRLAELLSGEGCSQENIIECLESAIDDTFPEGDPLRLRAMASVGQAHSCLKTKESEVTYAESVLFLTKIAAIAKIKPSLFTGFDLEIARKNLNVSNPEDHFNCTELGMPNFFKESKGAQ